MGSIVVSDAHIIIEEVEKRVVLPSEATPMSLIVENEVVNGQLEIDAVNEDARETVQAEEGLTSSRDAEIGQDMPPLMDVDGVQQQVLSHSDSKGAQHDAHLQLVKEVILDPKDVTQIVDERMGNKVRFSKRARSRPSRFIL